MELVAALVSIAVALSLGAISPGPSFLMVARTSLALSRHDGLAAALGMGIGGVVFAVIALGGLLTVLAAVPWLYVALKVVGGSYLAYLGYRIWRGASRPLVVDPVRTANAVSQPSRSFLLGLATQVSNPKTAIVYASVFASLLPNPAPTAVWIALPVLVLAIETLWYATVALALSAPTPRARYLASKRWLDRAAGAVMAALGLKLVLEGQSG